MSTGVPAAHACGRAAVGYAIGNGVSSRWKPAKTSGSDQSKYRADCEQPPRDQVDVSGMAAARQAPGAEGRVVGPDRAVVVRERVVGGVPGRHRADPPARPELLAHQPARDRIDALRRDDPAPEQMADVRAERVDALLLAVERKRVVAAAVLDPELLVEAALQLGRLRLEPDGERIVPPDGARELGRPQLRVVDVALHLDRCDRGHGRCGRRGSAASRRSPSTTGSRARAASGARTRRSRRRHGRRTRRSSAERRAPAPCSRWTTLGSAVQRQTSESRIR